jgi:hypothetical protein
VKEHTARPKEEIESARIDRLSTQPAMLPHGSQSDAGVPMDWVQLLQKRGLALHVSFERQRHNMLGN